MKPVRVAVRSADPISRAGVTSHLARRADVTLVEDDTRARADVLVVVTDRLPLAMPLLHRSAREAGIPVVLVTNRIAESELVSAVECRVVAILSRTAATDERLAWAVRAAALSGGVMPSHLLKHIERLRREVFAADHTPSCELTAREVEVLRLMAEGLDTAEVATRLCYSERTVKNVVSAVTTRLNLRNRVHAVAYAVRAGMI